jgi:hypothetical protein
MPGRELRAAAVLVEVLPCAVVASRLLKEHCALTGKQALRIGAAIKWLARMGKTHASTR